jgi:hypothetical protein
MADGKQEAVARRPRNVFARNWRSATFDVTLGWPWRLAVGRRRWTFLRDDPVDGEQTIEVCLGPIRITSWVKSPATRLKNQRRGGVPR